MTDEALIELLHGIKTGDCWCPKGIGNPMMKSHTVGCLAARDVYNKCRRAILDRLAQDEIAAGTYDLDRWA